MAPPCLPMIDMNFLSDKEELNIVELKNMWLKH